MEGDQLLAINGSALDISHHDAIRLLQGATGTVRLLVARDTGQPVEAAPTAAPPAPQRTEGEGGEEEEREKEEGEEEDGTEEDKGDMVLSTEWTQLEVIDLINDGSGLGFGIIGGRSTGVVVKTILPGGIADKDGHLQSGDHILQIGDVNVRGMASEQVALVLRQSGSHVRLVVARAVHEPPPFQIPHAPIIPTHQLEEHMEQFNAAVMALELQQQHMQQQQQQQTLIGSVQVHPQPLDLLSDVSDVDVFEVDLAKDDHGLGITIAGYIGGDNSPDEISGIFVKSIGEGSAAGLDGRVKVNDQIIEVDSKSLQGFSNHQAVEVLRNTGQTVRLRLVRFRHGPKYDKLQEYLAQANQTSPVPSAAKETAAVSNPTYDLDSGPGDLEDNLDLDEDFSAELSIDTETSTKSAWEPIVGPDFIVVVAQLSKFKEGGGLGISLEGTVDVEEGVEVRPHHYIRSILSDGPVGLNNTLKSSDELLEVNGRRLLGLNHVNVVEILKDLPQHVRLVCARRVSPLPDSFSSPDLQMAGESPYPPGVDPGPLVKAKSEMALSSEPEQLGALSKSKSRSLEPLTGLAMWSSEPVVIELEKSDHGLGFSILDYQDPVNPSDTVIVIRSLVPGGVAQQDGRLVPGDRLVFVNEVDVEHASLEQAVGALKGAARGTVLIGVAKPLPLSNSLTTDLQFPNYENTSSSAFSDTGAQLSSFNDNNQQHNFHFLQNVQVDEDDSLLSALKREALETHYSAVNEPMQEASNFNGDLNFAPSTLDPQKELHLDIPGVDIERSEVQALNSDPSSVKSLVQSEAGSSTSEASGQVVTPTTPSSGRRRDSFYESDDEQKTPRRSSPRKKKSDNEPSPPTYDSAVSVSPATPLSVAMVTAADNKLLSAASSSASPSSSTYSSAAASPRQPDILPLSSPRQTENRSPVMGDLVLVSTSAPVNQALPSYKEVTSSVATQPVENVTVDESTDAAEEKEDLMNEIMQSLSQAPIARLDTTDSDSDQRAVRSALHHAPSSSSSSPDPTLTSSDLTHPPASARPQETIHINKVGQHLGLALEAVDKAANGCQIKSIASPSAAEQDGRLQPGDMVLSINNESLKRITSAQARAILRRASLQGSEISITYTPAPSMTGPIPSPSYDAKQTPLMQKLSQSFNTSAHSPPASEVIEPEVAAEAAIELKASGGQKTLGTDGSPAVGNQAWGPPRALELVRETGKSLGISIVGGRVDMFNVSQDHCNAGIFIKHVLADSPAGRNGTLKKGDRILEVNHQDVRNATHDEAVEVIRNSASPITFLVQSLSYSSPPGDLEASRSDKPVEESIVPQTVESVEQAPAPVMVPSDSEEEDQYGYTTKRVQQKYCDLPGQVQLVALERGSQGMGLGLAGNKDRSRMSVFVAGIQPDSPAARDGGITVGDELLEVNGHDLTGMSHLNASAVIKGVTTPTVKVVTHRREDSLEHMAIKPLRYGGSAQFDANSVVPPNYETEPPVSSTDLPHTPAATEEESEAAPSVPSVPSVPSASAPVVVAAEAPPSPSPPAIEIVNTDVKVIVLNKQGSHGLGFGIQEDTREGRLGIYVKSITHGGCAAKDNQLMVGDEILEVGDKSLCGLHYDKAIDILRTTQGTVRLKVRKVGGQVDGTMTLQNTTGESSTDPVDGDPSDPRSCPILLGRRTYIEIEKGKTGLGLSIVGGSDTLLGAIIIHEVYQDGAAARDTRLWAGDQILEVNEEDLTEASHNRALQVLRQTPPVVKIAVYRDESQVREEDILDVFTVDLMKRPGKGLGLSIVGKKNDVGIYISDIVKGGVAEADGRLMQGDQILSVNSEDMRNSTQEYAAAVLKTLMGKVALTVGRLKAGSKASSRKNSTGGTSLKKSDSSASNKSKSGRHSKSASEDASHLRVVELEQDPTGSFGLSIAGGVNSPLGDAPVIIASMNPTGPAAISGKLKVGDKILTVNGDPTDDMSHDQVVSSLRASRKVELEVMQGEAVSISGGQRSRQVSGDMSDLTLKDVNIDLEDEGQPPQFKTITLNRGPEGLGFSIVGGHGSPHGDLPIYVKTVFNKGAAADEGTLCRGDQILSVNGQSLESFTHEEAVNILKNTQGIVSLGILS